MKTALPSVGWPASEQAELGIPLGTFVSGRPGLQGLNRAGRCYYDETQGQLF